MIALQNSYLSRGDIGHLRDIWPDLLQRPEWAEIAGTLGLSTRQRQVIEAVLEGDDDILIAERLGIAIGTVHTHFERLYRKLGVQRRSELVSRVFAEHLRLHTAARSATTMR